MGIKVTLTGATGLIGPRLVERLVQEGAAVTVLSRSPEAALAKLPGIAKALPWQPAEQPPPAEAIAGADAIIHLAGETVAGRWTSKKKRRILESRQLGTRNLVAALGAEATRPSVLISASAVGYYGDRGDELLTEDSRPGQDFLAQVCCAWEAEALAAQSHGVRVVLMRTGIVLGPGGALAKMVPLFRMGVGGPMGDGAQWMPWIHLEDEVGLFLTALGDARLRGPINATAPQPVHNRDFTRTLAGVLHRPAKLRAPAFALRLALGEFAGALLGGQRAMPQKALATGYPFQYPALGAAIASAVGR